MKKIERETEYIPGFSYYDCDVVAVTFGNNHGNNNNNGRRKRINICRIKIQSVRTKRNYELRTDSYYYILQTEEQSFEY